MAYAAWAATTSYAVGAIVRATAVQDFGLVFKCTTAGTSGSTQPTWPTLLDGTVVDGSVTWTAISAVYELVEWGVAELDEAGSAAFLGTQGDIWDTQKDMALCLIGATVAVITLARAHDHSMGRLRS